ncbi:MAG: uracil phosphoribosyltransferase [Bacteroidetes bacterium RIFCSPLOWO2_12_FULL_35_15]|nr:MAG: uracil phosphoribosyltransferase [Bacteroidetes bacterium RIFCSPLOWO2_12_FULL_35_15]
MVRIIGNHNSIFNHFISEIRDENIQKDSMRFRRNIERMGEIMAYEISKVFTYEIREVVTPLGISNISLLKEQPVIASILRAGLPLHQGLLNYFDRADNAFISAYRKHHKDGTFDIQLEYVASPEITDKVLVLCDPMLATGASIVHTYKALLLRGKPKHTHIVSLIASLEGVDYAKKHLPENVTIWCGAIDEELTAQSYIVPGLGDAGDLAYGKKV